MDHISFATGITALNEVLANCLTSGEMTPKGETDGLLLGMPIYGAFAADMESTSNCNLIYAEFGEGEKHSSAM
jgi:hypothetical protein